MNDRDPRLTELLDAAVPRIADDGDWAAVIGRASTASRPRLVWRRLAPALAVAAAVAVFAVLLVSTDDGRETVPATPVETIPAPPPTPAPTVGETLVKENGCLSCHLLGGNGAEGPGPDLSIEGRRGRGTEWQIKHLKDPRSLVPGSTMPAFTGFTDEEYEQIATYLESLGVSTSSATFSILDRPRVPADTAPANLVPTLPRSPGGDPIIDETRLALEREGVRYFVAPATDGSVCVLAASQGTVQVSCREREVLARANGWMILTDAHQVTIIPDGFDLVRIETSTGTTEVPIVNNVLVVTTPPATSPGGPAIVTGPAGTVELTIPPSAGSAPPATPPPAGSMTTVPAPPPPAPGP